MKKKILVAPLNWGLGHATRCIPIINALISHNYAPILASDGAALELLKKEFPKLQTVILPSYKITYPKSGKYFKIHLIKNFPRLISTIYAEKKVTDEIIKTYNISGIISDNRLGVYFKKAPSVIITHQLTVLSGNTTWLSSFLHRKLIKRFTECWVPDYRDAPNLSGKLGHPNNNTMSTIYLGPLSRFSFKNLPKKYDLMVLLSGPEPQRTLLEEILFKELNGFKGDLVFVRGIVSESQSVLKKDNMTLYNFMTSMQLEQTINESSLVLSRSGYTTIMDLSKLKKRAFFIPTPGQFEQEYLAKRLTEKKLVPSCNQQEFTIEKLKEIEDFDGLNTVHEEINFGTLFSRLF